MFNKTARPMAATSSDLLRDEDSKNRHEDFFDRNGFERPPDHGRLHIQITDVRARMVFFCRI